MICFHFFIFDQSATAKPFFATKLAVLWFAFIFLSLINQQQHCIILPRCQVCCDLLSFFYLWSISNSQKQQRRIWNRLWFAFIFLSLINQQQRDHLDRNPIWAVICFHFFIFDQSATACMLLQYWCRWLWFAFIFLSLINQQQRNQIENIQMFAVICFHFFIFDQSATAIFTKQTFTK